MPDPTTPPVDPGDAAFQQWLASQSGSTNQLIQGGDGNWYIVDKATGVVTPVPGVPAKDAKTTAPKTVRDPNTGVIYTVNADGTLTAQTDPSQKPVTPKDTVPGTGNPGTTNWDAPLPVTTGATPDLPVDVFSAQTARATQEETARKNAADESSARTTAILKAQAADLQAQVEAGKLSNSQAIQQFDTQVQMLTAGQSSGMDAAKLAQMGTENRVGPNFGANFASALTGIATGDRSKVHFSPNDFTYATPDYAGIARNATAQALAHLSPYAASIAGSANPMPAYGGVAPGGADPAAMPAQFTAPHPPMPGFGSYRPGG